jgi:hypothetical protein
VELTMTTDSDPVTAALDQLAAHHEHIGRLDEREASHFATLTTRFTGIAGLTTGLTTAVSGHASALARLEGLDRQVAGLAAQLGGSGHDGQLGQDPEAYQPVPVPKWWKLTGQARQDAIARLRAWVDQVYRPGYGQLAATLGPCWETHDLCLYALDIASDLWSVLYLQPTRSPGLLSAQAEYQTRILPALAEQLMAETSRCGHTQARRPLNGAARSSP